MKSKILGIMGVVGLLFAGCSSEDDFLSSFHNDPNAVHITAEVGKASADGFTRSNPLGATEEEQKKFNQNDEISVKAAGQAAVTYKFNGNEWQPQGEKFLKWESETMNFTAFYPASYHGGTITQPTEYTSVKSLADADYMSFSGSQSNTKGDNNLTLSMERKMARVVVDIADFNDQYADATVNNINSLTIKGVKAYKHSDNKFYALMVPCDAQSAETFLSLEVGENNTETLTGIPALVAGKSYTYQLTVGKNKVVVTGITVKNWTTGQTIDGGKATFIPYVTFTAEGEQTFKMTTKNNYDLSKFQYSLNEGEWKEVVADEAVSFGGDKGTLRLRGTNINGTADAYIGYSIINFAKKDVKVACTGDIRALLDWENYKTINTQYACFCSLFENCEALTSAPDLPAETLADNCYSYMFTGCTNLKEAPELPATTLANSCYSNMFAGCTNLKKAPALPAETLDDYCYFYMFEGCTNLIKTAPKMPAETLKDYCYKGMFSGCKSLEKAPALPAETLASDCYSYMFRGCTNLKEAPKLPATTLANSCYSSMFEGCTNLKEAPKLTATKLAEYCYFGMFSDCTSLSSVTMLAPSDQITNTSECCYGWLAGAGNGAVSRTLILKDKDAYNALATNSDYLPNKWKIGTEGTTVKDAADNPITE